jgi:hypothetical protein
MGLLAPLLAAQPGLPTIGQVEYYGIHRVPEQRIGRALGVKPGDPLPPSKGDIEDRLEQIPGVVQSRLEAVCCRADGSATLFVGIEEKGSPHFAFRSPPEGTATLPADLVDTYRKLLEAMEAAGRRGSTAQDLTQGHALAADPDARALQQSFTIYAKKHVELLRGVLRNAGDEEQRAMAATIIGYAADKAKVVDDLEYAMQDPAEAVRANALRSLEAVAVLAARQPARGLRIPSTWFVEMLNSIVLGDRLQAAAALVNLTEKDGKATLDQIRERAPASVLEMAQWRSLEYALPSYILLGRMAGLSEQQIQETWSRGERESLVSRFAGKR